MSTQAASSGRNWRRATLAMAFGLGLVLADKQAVAQSSATIRIVVPFPAGGGVDFLARVLAEEIGRKRQARIVVENRPGGATVIATESVSHAQPDGNTLLMNASSFVINAQLRKLNYDPLMAFAPICKLVRSPTLLLVNASSPYRTLADLLDDARKRPGQITLASVGPATNFQIAFEALKRAAGVDMTYVPFAGGGPAITALLGGHVSSAFANYVEAIEQINAGTLRAVATGSIARIDRLPDVPTLAEAGFNDVEAENWFGVVAPAGVPVETTSRLVDWFTSALDQPDVVARLSGQGLYPNSTCGADFATFLRRQYDGAGRIVKAANIKAE